jgi:zinc transport system substrate-binding protein
MNKKTSKSEAQFDKRSVPAVIVFILLLVVGFTLFFYWRAKRGIGEEEEKVTVAVTIFPIYDIAKNIIGDNEFIELVLIVPEDMDPESYELSASSEQLTENAKLFMKVGVGFDDWVSEGLGDSPPEADPPLAEKIIDLSESVELIQKANGIVTDFEQICLGAGGTWLSDYSECEGIEESICNDNSGEYDNCASSCRNDPEADMCVQVCVQVCKFDQEMIVDEEVQYSPYYWLSIENAKSISEKVYEELVLLKPEYSSEFYKNLQDYLQSLDEAKSYIKGKVKDLKDKNIITYRNNFVYFAGEYDIKIVDTLEPFSSQSKKISLLEVVEIEKVLAEHERNVLFIDSFIEQDVDEELDFEIKTLYVYRTPEETSSYIDMMREMINQIASD